MSQVNNTPTSPTTLTNQQLLAQQERAHVQNRPGAEHAKGEHHHHGGGHGTKNAASTPSNTLTSPTSPFGDE